MNRQEKETLDYLAKTLIPDLYHRLTIAENRIKQLETNNHHLKGLFLKA